MKTDDNEEIFFPEDDNLGADTEAEETTADVEDDEDEEMEEEAGASDPTAELEKRYMALFAEYENFRKRTAKEKENLYADAIATVTADFLGVIDNLDRALASAKNADENSIDSIIAGIEMVEKQSEGILNKLGVTEIEASRGTKFDPNLHEAVMHVDDPDLGEQEIAQVFQKGYIYKERVVRHSVVQVAN